LLALSFTGRYCGDATYGVHDACPAHVTVSAAASPGVVQEGLYEKPSAAQPAPEVPTAGGVPPGAPKSAKLKLAITRFPGQVTYR
jgi:hypothetical protein